MGTVIHEATLVTSSDERMIDAAHLEALRIFPAEMVTSIAVSPVNWYSTFAILPCGSKEGWPEKSLDTAQRDEFLLWVEAQSYDGGSNCLNIGTVRYGNDLPRPTAPAADGTE